MLVLAPDGSNHVGALILGWLLAPAVIAGLLVLVVRLGRRAAGRGSGGRQLSAEGFRIALRMRVQVPPRPEPKWQRKHTATVTQAAITE